jgi:hypothetical protein
MTMGPGSTRIRVTYDQTITGQNFTSFSTLFGLNNELINQFHLYKYFRIKSANVVIFANNLSNAPAYITVDWDGKTVGHDRLYRNDSVKMVPGYLTRTKVFTFIPPNTTITFNNTQRFAINYTEWSTTESIKSSTGDYYQFPSYYVFDVPDVSLPVRFELIIDLRGNQIYEPESGKINLKQIKEEEEDIKKPLFYNSKKLADPNLFKSKSEPKMNIFNFPGKEQANTLFG